MNKKQSKLVRDLIVAIITESGRGCSWRYVGSREEHMNLLIDKLDEESYELMCAESHRERVEEAAHAPIPSADEWGAPHRSPAQSLLLCSLLCSAREGGDP